MQKVMVCICITITIQGLGGKHSICTCMVYELNQNSSLTIDTAMYKLYMACKLQRIFGIKDNDLSWLIWQWWKFHKKFWHKILWLLTNTASLLSQIILQFTVNVRQETKKYISWHIARVKLLPSNVTVGTYDTPIKAKGTSAMNRLNTWK